MRQARIMEFRYPSKGDDSENIEMTAKNFLIRLTEKRQDCPARPIIFVAHANGGLVLERAFVLDRISPVLPPQLIRLRADVPVPNQGTASSSPDDPPSSPPGPDRHNISPANEKTWETDSDHIPPPKALHAPSVVAGAIFLETSTDNPGEDVHFHSNFLSVIVEWDIPVRWYSSSQQLYGIQKQAKNKRSTGPLFGRCMSEVVFGFQND
jgi:hypothetical protein